MKVIKQKDFYDVRVEVWETSIVFKQLKNTEPHQEAVIIEREKLKSLIEFLQKEVEKNDTE